MGVLTAAAKAAKAARTAAKTASMKAASIAKQLAKEAALAKKKAAEAKAKIKANQTNLGGKTSTRGKPKDTPAKAEADRKRASTRIKDNKNKAAAKTVEKKGSVAKKMTVSKTDIREAETAIAIQNYIRKINAMKDGLHCFRVLVQSEARNTIFFSFAKYKEEYKYDSFYYGQLYGTTTHGFTCSNGTTNANGNGLTAPSSRYQLDLLLDCVKNKICIGYVKNWPDLSLQEVKFNDLPSDWKWVPTKLVAEKHSSICFFYFS